MRSEPKEIIADLATGTDQTIWEKCFREEICVRVPFDGKKCVSASGCVRILFEGGVYKLEIELFGTRKKFALVDQCITGFTVGIASLKVCLTNVKIENGRLKSVRVTARLCIGAKIGPIHLEKCWDVIGTDIKFFILSDYKPDTNQIGAIMSQAYEYAAMANADYVYLETDDGGSE